MKIQIIDSERRINSAQVKAICGGVSDMTLYRWARDRGFPQPIYIGERKYWREEEVIKWLNNRPKQKPVGRPRKNPWIASVSPPWQK